MWLVLVAVLMVPLAGGAADLSPGEREQNIQSFEYVWKTVRDKHWDPRLNGIDWQAVHEELRPKIEQADSNAKASDIMNQMLGRLKQSHFAVIPGSIGQDLQGERSSGEGPGSRDGATGLDVRLIAGQVLVTSVEPGSPASQAGIRPGWEVIAINGRELAPVIVAVSKTLDMSGMQALVARGVVLNRLAGKPGNAVRVQLRNGQDQVVELFVQRVQPRGLRTTLGFLPPLYAWSEWRKLDGEVGYLAFNVFMDPENLMKTVTTAVTSCLQCKGFIIDLRGNLGGMGGMAMGLAGWFVEQKGHRLGTMRTRETSLNFVINPRPVTYGGPLAILVDSCSASTAEIFSGGLKDLKRASIFGSRTAGAALPAMFEKLPNGDAFMYAFADYVSEAGQRLEGGGVEPDVAIEPTRESLLQGRDRVLDAAIDWVKQKKQGAAR